MCRGRPRCDHPPFSECSMVSRDPMEEYDYGGRGRGHARAGPNTWLGTVMQVKHEHGLKFLADAMKKARPVWAAKQRAAGVHVKRTTTAKKLKKPKAKKPKAEKPKAKKPTKGSKRSTKGSKRSHRA